MSNCRTGEIKEEFAVYSLIYGKLQKLTYLGIGLTVNNVLFFLEKANTLISLK